MHKITPCLWLDGDVEEAVKFYLSVFKKGKSVGVMRTPDGANMLATFELEGLRFSILSGGPQSAFSESISFMVDCEDQAEVDGLWEKLTADGGEESMCGWLKDKHGVSWQITPRVLLTYMNDEDKEKAGRVMQAMLKMRKIEIRKIQDAYDGK